MSHVAAQQENQRSICTFWTRPGGLTRKDITCAVPNDVQQQPRCQKLEPADLKYQNSVQLICEGVEPALMEELEACQEFITLPGLSHDILLLIMLDLMYYRVRLMIIR